jgi:hypothetical protein
MTRIRFKSRNEKLRIPNSYNADRVDISPIMEIRPLLLLPREHRIACWQEIVAEPPPDELTGKVVSRRNGQHAETSCIAVPGRRKP